MIIQERKSPFSRQTFLISEAFSLDSAVKRLERRERKGFAETAEKFDRICLLYARLASGGRMRPPLHVTF